MKKDELIVKICKKVIVVFGILTAFNFIMLISGKSYALFTRTITTNDPVIHIETAKELPGPKANDTLKETLGKLGGIIGITNDNQIVTEDNGNVREWRYSGQDVNNYVYYNCDNISNQTKDSCELWRIVGIFKDEKGVEHLKIVKDDILSANVFPLTYTINGVEYNIQKWDNSNKVYWNAKVSGESNNDWTTAGLQYFLNTESDDNQVHKGYLSYLKTDYKNMIEDTTYYLGNYGFYDEYFGGGTHNYYSDTTIEAYDHERSNIPCDSSIIGNSYGEYLNGESKCSVWYGNKATWKGKIGLLYPSDFGFSVLDANTWKEKEIINILWDASWLQHVDGEWCFEELLLSPTSMMRDSTAAPAVTTNGFYDASKVKPTLYLKSNVRIIDGEGSQDDPYQFS